MGVHEAVRVIVAHPSAPSPLRHGAFTIEGWQFESANAAPVENRRQRVFNETRKPWAEFLVQVHNRIHPIFADEYLASLDQLPAKIPLNSPELTVTVGAAVTQSSGEISLLYIRHPSGMPEFDVAAVAALVQAFPMTVPEAIASPDGLAYFEWEFHRNKEACSALNARPFRFAQP